MISTPSVLVSLATVSASSVAVAATEEMPSGQQWTVLALLAMVVLGIGGKLVLAIETNTKTIAEVGTKLQLMIQESLTARAEVEKARNEVREHVEDLPRHVVDELQRRKSA